MELLSWPWFPFTAGLLIGGVMGFAARHAHFCALNAIERWTYAGDASGMRAWTLAALVAMLVTQAMLYFGLIDVAGTFYLSAALGLTGAIAGGLMFGYGMALTGTCGFGALVRLGGGSLKSLVALIVLAIFALATQKGILSVPRVVLVDNLAIDLSPARSQSLPDLATSLVGADVALLVVGMAGLALAAFAFTGIGTIRGRPKMIAGAVIGLCVGLGWLVTSLAARHALEPVQIEAGSFVVPVADTIVQITAFTGTLPDYGVGLVIGVVLGAAISAVWRHDVRWEACDDARELSRHMAGAALMGAGGVMAMGCTIGQGVSAVSLLALSAPIVVGAIIVGARMGLAYLLEGSSFAAFQPRDKAPAE